MRGRSEVKCSRDVHWPAAYFLIHHFKWCALHGQPHATLCLAWLCWVLPLDHPMPTRSRPSRNLPYARERGMRTSPRGENGHTVNQATKSVGLGQITTPAEFQSQIRRTACDETQLVTWGPAGQLGSSWLMYDKRKDVNDRNMRVCTMWSTDEITHQRK